MNTSKPYSKKIYVKPELTRQGMLKNVTAGFGTNNNAG